MATTLEKELKELVLALALFLGGLGYAVSGLPANIVVGCVIWGLAWMFITHLFFVSDYTEPCSTDVKVAFWGAVTLLVVLILLRPIQTQYAKEHAPTPSSPEPQQFPPPAKPPTPSQVRSYLVFDGIMRFGERRDAMGQLVADQNLHVGDELFFNYYTNPTGPNPILVGSAARLIILEPDFSPKSEQEAIESFKAQVKKAHVKSKWKTLMPQDTGRWDTAHAWTEDGHHLLITQPLLNDLRTGTQIAYGLVEISYKDNGKLHHLRTCQFLQPPTFAPGTWHFCDNFTNPD